MRCRSQLALIDCVVAIRRSMICIQGIPQKQRLNQFVQLMYCLVQPMSLTSNSVRRGSEPHTNPAGIPARSVRVINPEANQKNIIEVATAEFAEHGLSGARVDEIAAKTHCSKRLIYYYFKDKEGLYLAVLEHVYGRVRQVESEMDLAVQSPPDALRQLVAFRFDHHRQNKDFVRLVMIENIHYARFLAQSETIRALTNAAVERVDAVYRRGVKEGVFRKGLKAIDIHWQISALSFYSVSNQATFSTLFKCDLEAPATARRMRENVIETILRFVSLQS